MVRSSAVRILRKYLPVLPSSWERCKRASKTLRFSLPSFRSVADHLAPLRFMKDPSQRSQSAVGVARGARELESLGAIARNLIYSHIRNWRGLEQPAKPRRLVPTPDDSWSGFHRATRQQPKSIRYANRSHEPKFAKPSPKRTSRRSFAGLHSIQLP